MKFECIIRIRLQDDIELWKLCIAIDTSINDWKNKRKLNATRRQFCFSIPGLAECCCWASWVTYIFATLADTGPRGHTLHHNDLVLVDKQYVLESSWVSNPASLWCSVVTLAELQSPSSFYPRSNHPIVTNTELIRNLGILKHCSQTNNYHNAEKFWKLVKIYLFRNSAVNCYCHFN